MESMKGRYVYVSLWVVVVAMVVVGAVTGE